MSAVDKAFCIFWNAVFIVTLCGSIYLHDMQSVKTSMVALAGYWTGRMSAG